MMGEQTVGVENNYLNELYKDLYLKSSMDVNATIDIISRIEDLSCGASAVANNEIISQTSCLPGKQPMTLVTDFEKFWATTTQHPSLNNLLELRNSLYRFQSLS